MEVGATKIKHHVLVACGHSLLRLAACREQCKTNIKQGIIYPINSNKNKNAQKNIQCMINIFNCLLSENEATWTSQLGWPLK